MTPSWAQIYDSYSECVIFLRMYMLLEFIAKLLPFDKRVSYGTQGPLTGVEYGYSPSSHSPASYYPSSLQHSLPSTHLPVSSTATLQQPISSRSRCSHINLPRSLAAHRRPRSHPLRPYIRRHPNPPRIGHQTRPMMQHQTRPGVVL